MKAEMNEQIVPLIDKNRLAAAAAMKAAQENNYIEFVQEAAVEAAKVALDDTINQNPVLKKAGVVDAGGKGWLFVMEAMLSSLRGEDIVVPEGFSSEEAKEQADFGDFNTDDITFTY